MCVTYVCPICTRLTQEKNSQVVQKEREKKGRKERERKKERTKCQTVLSSKTLIWDTICTLKELSHGILS